MTPQELTSSILQLAIQGKLVEQRPEEGTGEELYRQIQAEKQALIKAGKIKKEKPLPEIWTAYRKIDSEIKHPPVVELRKSKLRYRKSTKLIWLR